MKLIAAFTLQVVSLIFNDMAGINFFFKASKKIILFSAVSLLYFKGFASDITAVDWSDLEEERKYELMTRIPLAAENQNGTNPLFLEKGQKWIYNQVQDSDSPVIHLKFYQLNCERPSEESDLSLFNLDPTETEDLTIGLRLSTGCILDIYLEPRNYFKPSVFILH